MELFIHRHHYIISNRAKSIADRFLEFFLFHFHFFIDKHLLYVNNIREVVKKHFGKASYL